MEGHENDVNVTVTNIKSWCQRMCVLREYNSCGDPRLISAAQMAAETQIQLFVLRAILVIMLRRLPLPHDKAGSRHQCDLGEYRVAKRVCSKQARKQK